MRPFSLLFAFSLALIIPAYGVQAGVLLPEDNKTTDTTPNLGLVPSGKNVSSPSIGLTPVVPSTTEAAQQNTPPAGIEPSFSQPSTTTTKTIIRPGGTVVQNKNQKDSSASLTRSLAQGKVPNSLKSKPSFVLDLEEKIKSMKKEMGLKTLIIPEEPDLSSYLGNMPNAKKIQVTISDKYMWGVMDAQMISSMLGYEPQEIPANCQLRMRVEATTENGRAPLNVYSGETRPFSYTGDKISNLEMTAWGVCRPPKTGLPDEGGSIRMVGNNYGIQLRQGSCAFDTSRTKLLVSYAGDGQVSCSWK